MVKLIASFFYLGYLPLAPGTLAGWAGMGVYLLLNFFAPGFIPEKVKEIKLIYVIFLAIFFLAGIYFAGRGEKVWQQKDSPFIVIDETFSFFLTMFCLPFSAKLIAVGFLLNRFFDIVKPYPAHRLEKISGGWGVMLDDVVAGVYSNLVLRLLLRLLS